MMSTQRMEDDAFKAATLLRAVAMAVEALNAQQRVQLDHCLRDHVIGVREAVAVISEAIGLAPPGQLTMPGLTPGRPI
jgi:hypothetical protein